jgi:hypothetical protein
MDTDSVNFNAVAENIRKCAAFIRQAFTDGVPDALTDTPDAEQIKAVNTFLDRQRAMAKVDLGGDMEAEGDVNGLIREMCEEIERLGCITASGLDVDSGSGGIGIAKAEE